MGPSGPPSTSPIGIVAPRLDVNLESRRAADEPHWARTVLNHLGIAAMKVAAVWLRSAFYARAVIHALGVTEFAITQSKARARERAP